MEIQIWPLQLTGMVTAMIHNEGELGPMKIRRFGSTTVTMIMDNGNEYRVQTDGTYKQTAGRFPE